MLTVVQSTPTHKTPKRGSSVHIPYLSRCPTEQNLLPGCYCFHKHTHASLSALCLVSLHCLWPAPLACPCCCLSSVCLRVLRTPVCLQQTTLPLLLLLLLLCSCFAFLGLFTLSHPEEFFLDAVLAPLHLVAPSATASLTTTALVHCNTTT